MAPPPACVGAEHRHQVHGGQGHAGQAIQVGPVGAVEAEPLKRLAVELGMQVLGATAAILVGQHLDHRRLGAGGQPRDHPHSAGLPP